MSINEQKPAQDFAQVLRRDYAESQQAGVERSKFQMGVKNQRKLERIRERVKQLRGAR